MQEKSEPEFPYLAMLALCMGVLAHVIVLTSPLPYVAFMVVDFGMAKDLDVAGYSAGWIAGIFMVGRLISGIPFGMASDKWGRKPCLIISMVNVAIFSVIFGFSTSYVMALCTRCLIGFGNGFIGIAMTCVSELNTTKEHETRGFGYFNGIYGLGYIIGPAVGGILARPALQYPKTFSEDSLFGQYPYLLPSMVCSLFSLIAAALLFVYLPETLKPKGSGEKKQQLDNAKDVEMSVSTAIKDTKVQNTASYGALPQSDDTYVKLNDTSTTASSSSAAARASSGTPTSMLERRPSLLERRPSLHFETTAEDAVSISEILNSPRLSLLLFSNLMFQSLTVMIEEVFPMWCVSSIARGGMGWTSAQVGTVLSCVGVMLVIFQLFIYERVMKFFSNVANEVVFVYQLIISAVPIMILPVVVSIIRSNEPASSGSHTSTLLYVTIIILFAIHSNIVGIGYSSVAMVTNASVSDHVRGTMNGLTMTAASLGNFVAPVLGSNLLALFNNLDSNIINGKMFFIVSGLSLITLALGIKEKFCKPPVQEK